MVGVNFLRCDLISGCGGLFRRDFLCLGAANTLQWPGRSNPRIPQCCSLINMRRRFIGQPGLILIIAVIKFPGAKCYR